MSPVQFPLHGRHVAIIDGCTGFGLSVASLVRTSGGYVSLLGRDEDNLHEAAFELHGARIVVRQGDPIRDLVDLLQGAAPVDYLIMPAAVSGQCGASAASGFDRGACRISDLVSRALKLTPAHCQIALIGPEHEPLDDDLLAILSEHAVSAPVMMLENCDSATVAAAVLQEILSHPARMQLLRGRLRLEEPQIQGSR